ncbi:hypothetical protein PROFUN_14807 [Planoprotostelium fungivorum]|uniref:Complex 1 LYR protein domain-containing protein n=1 Tax=Planoprotostelium fungivorum TaxID=1890364 RepID=A0A2P6MYS6_9EUKA|nr:hypothetical protein PROFUN_14807 [Planoprotostelium fungivorum]
MLLMRTTLTEPVTRQMIFNLYRVTLRAADRLTLTEPRVYLNLVRKEFRKFKDVKDEQEVKRLYEIGLRFRDNQFGAVL